MKYFDKLKRAKQTGFNEGLTVGENVMCDIVTVALYNVFGFGKTNPEKWKLLSDEVQRLYEEVYQKGDVRLGFEHLVQALVIIKGEEARAEIEDMYKNVLYMHNSNNKIN